MSFDLIVVNCVCVLLYFEICFCVLGRFMILWKVISGVWVVGVWDVVGDIVRVGWVFEGGLGVIGVVLECIKFFCLVRDGCWFFVVGVWFFLLGLEIGEGGLGVVSWVWFVGWWELLVCDIWWDIFLFIVVVCWGFFVFGVLIIILMLGEGMCLLFVVFIWLIGLCMVLLFWVGIGVVFLCFIFYEKWCLLFLFIGGFFCFVLVIIGVVFSCFGVVVVCFFGMDLIILGFFCFFVMVGWVLWFFLV